MADTSKVLARAISALQRSKRFRDIGDEVRQAEKVDKELQEKRKYIKAHALRHLTDDDIDQILKRRSSGAPQRKPADLNDDDELIMKNVRVDLVEDKDSSLSLTPPTFSRSKSTKAESLDKRSKRPKGKISVTTSSYSSGSLLSKRRQDNDEMQSVHTATATLTEEGKSSIRFGHSNSLSQVSTYKSDRSSSLKTEDGIIHTATPKPTMASPTVTFGEEPLTESTLKSKSQLVDTNNASNGKQGSLIIVDKNSFTKTAYNTAIRNLQGQGHTSTNDSSRDDNKTIDSDKSRKKKDGGKSSKYHPGNANSSITDEPATYTESFMSPTFSSSQKSRSSRSRRSSMADRTKSDKLLRSTRTRSSSKSPARRSLSGSINIIYGLSGESDTSTSINSASQIDIPFSDKSNNLSRTIEDELSRHDKQTRTHKVDVGNISPELTEQLSSIVQNLQSMILSSKKSVISNGSDDHIISNGLINEDKSVSYTDDFITEEEDEKLLEQLESLRQPSMNVAVTEQGRPKIFPIPTIGSYSPSAAAATATKVLAFPPGIEPNTENLSNYILEQIPNTRRGSLPPAPSVPSISKEEQEKAKTNPSIYRTLIKQAVESNERMYQATVHAAKGMNKLYHQKMEAKKNDHRGDKNVRARAKVDKQLQHEHEQRRGRHHGHGHGTRDRD